MNRSLFHRLTALLLIPAMLQEPGLAAQNIIPCGRWQGIHHTESDTQAFAEPLLQRFQKSFDIRSSAASLNKESHVVHVLGREGQRLLVYLWDLARSGEFFRTLFRSFRRLWKRPEVRQDTLRQHWWQKRSTPQLVKILVVNTDNSQNTTHVGAVLVRQKIELLQWTRVLTDLLPEPKDDEIPTGRRLAQMGRALWDYLPNFLPSFGPSTPKETAARSAAVLAKST